MKKPYKINTKHWYIERLTYLIAGIIILTSATLAYTININWIFLVGFVGLMLVIFALSGYCPMAILLKKLGIKEK